MATKTITICDGCGQTDKRFIRSFRLGVSTKTPEHEGTIYYVNVGLLDGSPPDVCADCWEQVAWAIMSELTVKAGEEAPDA